jgi:RNA recognition motif-containing protein
MGKRLYVGNLPFDVTEDKLNELFAPFGQVASASLITDKFTGQSKGFGFVEYSTDDEAKAAIEKMNGQNVGSRPITVSEARPREERGPRSGGGGGGGYGGGGGGGRRW